MTVASDGVLNAASLTLESSATGTATLINNGTANITSASVQQYLTTGRNWYISNPVSAAVPTVASGTITLNKYDETTVTNGAGTWTTTTDPLEIKKGYVASVSADGNITFTGTLNDGNQDITLSSRTGTADKAGFNLIGNPYPSYLDWNEVVTANTGDLRSTTMWYRTKSTTYNFWTVNGDGVGVPNGASVKIPPLQAFWVRAVEGGSTLNLTNAMRYVAPGTDKLLKAPASKNGGRTLVRLEVSNGTNTDEAVVYFSDNAQNGLDVYDAPKMSNDNPEIPEIHTTLGNEKIVINSMKSIPMDTPIGLGFVAGNGTAFSIKSNEISNIPAGVKVILKDKVTLSETDITDGTSVYSFAPETVTGDRFSIIFRSAGATTGVDNLLNSNNYVYVNADNQISINAPEKSTYCIYNVTGRIVAKGVISQSSYLTPRYSAGVYLVKLNNSVKRVIVK